MALAAGSRIGVYEIVAPLGAGGMGEVYRARDTRLGRDVALKILPDAFLADTERLARFEREARTLAALNHPHIAHLHGFDESSHTRALVMELVEGEDLADRIKRGPLPFREAVAIARQIAQALEAAHEQGIIHRDLKPANIKLRDDGTVKVLDFGLAKALEGASPVSGSSANGLLNSPTITSPAMTVHGMILGTAAYMAPEQAKGKAVDKRADIWAFGCVLYEMVTGRRAFTGDDVSDTLASVLRAEVDWAGVPAPLLRLLKKCLERDPKRRLHDIGDAFDLIDDTPVGIGSAPARQWIAWGVASLFAIAAGVLAVLHFRESTPAPDVLRFQIQPPPKTTFDIYLALSPDGRRLAFTARDDDGSLHLWVRDLASLEARKLPGTDDAWSPFWSPDSRFLAFGVDRQLKRIDPSGGLPQTICESPLVVGSGTWNRDNVIVFGTRNAGAAASLRRVNASGGTPAPVTAIDVARGEVFHAFPAFLPDGRRFTYFRQSNTPDVQGFYIGSLDAAPDRQSSTRLVAATGGPAHVLGAPAKQERLFYLRDGTLVVQSFDSSREQLVGDATPVVESVGSAGAFGFFSVASNDVLVYRTGTRTFTNFARMTWLDRKGQTVGTVGDPRPYSSNIGSLALSPDGTRAVVVVSPTQAGDLWVVEFERGTFTRLTFGDAPDLSPVWSPDGSRVAFRSNKRAGPAIDLFVKDVSGTTEETSLLENDTLKIPSDWSGDGRSVVFSRIAPKSAADLWLLPLEGDRTPLPLLVTPQDEAVGRLSPDGRWLAYQSNESGRPEIYLRPFSIASGKPTLGAKSIVSTDGGTTMRWRRDGRELFYRHPSGALMAVDVAVEANVLKPRSPRQLFAMPQNVFGWDVTPDGQRFLALLPVAPATSDPISVVVSASRTIGVDPERR